MVEKIDIRGLIGQDAPRILDEGSYAYPKLNRRGEICVIDFYTQMAMEKRGFEIRAGIDSTTETGDANIATTAAEMCADARSGLTIIPVYFNISIADAPGDTNFFGVKVINAVSSAGTAFVPLPLWTDSTIAAVSTGRMDDEGGVTTTADATTTTNVLTMGGGADNSGGTQYCHVWQPLLPAVCAGACCVYVQIGGSTGPEYHASLQYIEIPTTALE